MKEIRNIKGEPITGFDLLLVLNKRHQNLALLINKYKELIEISENEACFDEPNKKVLMSM